MIVYVGVNICMWMVEREKERMKVVVYSVIVIVCVGSVYNNMWENI